MQANPRQFRGDVTSADALLEIAVAAAAAAAEVIRDAASGASTLVWEEKGAADFVSEVDRAAESAIAGVVGARLPDAAIVGEELSPTHVLDGKGITIVADPLDGTTNFLHAYPQYAVSIGVLSDSEIVAGVIVNAATGDCFTAKSGGGAFLNGSPIRVSSIDDPGRALVGTGFPFKRHDLLEMYSAQFVEVSRHTAGIRRAGAAALDLADVACGRFDGFWELVLAPWDVAAGILLIREAGGVVTDLDGAAKLVSSGPVVAGNPVIHEWLLPRLQQFL